MQRASVAILQHLTSGEWHYDFLISDPTLGPDEPRPLWAGRIHLTPSQWHAAGAFMLRRLAPHRRRYLTYQGPIGGGRGSVRRIDAGSAGIRLWTDTRLVLDMHLTQFTGTIELDQKTQHHWQARIIPRTRMD